MEVWSVSGDQTEAIQAQIDSGGLVHLPAGDYNITTLDLRSNVTLRGDGKNVTRLCSSNETPSEGAVRLSPDESGYVLHARIQDLTIQTVDGFGVYAEQTSFDSVLGCVWLCTDCGEPLGSIHAAQCWYEGVVVSEQTEAIFTDRTTISKEAYAIAWAADELFLGYAELPDKVAVGLSCAAPCGVVSVEYWDGSDWRLISNTDRSYGARHRYHYAATPSGWTTSDVNEVTHYWLRLTGVPSLHAAYRFESNIIGLQVSGCSFDCGKEAIFGERAYHSYCDIDAEVRHVGGGCFVGVGNSNTVRINQEGGDRGDDYRPPLARVVLVGASNRLSGLIEGMSRAATGVYVSGRGLNVAGLNFEGGSGSGHYSFWAEALQSSSADRLVWSTSHPLRIDSGVQAHEGTSLTVGTIGDCYTGPLKGITIDSSSLLHVNKVEGAFCCGAMDHPNVVVDEYVPKDGTVLRGAPRSPNLIVNGDFASGLDDWTVTAQGDITYDSEVVNTSDGKRLRVTVTAGSASPAVIVSQDVTVPDEYDGAAGYLGHACEGDPGTQLLSKVGNTFTSARVGMAYVNPGFAAVPCIVSSGTVELLLYASVYKSIDVGRVQLTTGRRVQ